MRAEPVYLTPEGKASLEAELKELVEVIEPDLVNRMGDAARQGDLRENFAYHDLRRELGMKRGRIQELKNLLSNVVVVDTPAHTDGRVRLGSTVVVREDGYDEEEEYNLVTEAEASNPSGNGKARLSVTSPLGQALLDKRAKAGDKVSFTTPTGATLHFVVVRVE